MGTPRHRFGFPHGIDAVEVDDIIGYHDVVTAENWDAQIASPPQDGFAAAEPVGLKAWPSLRVRCSGC